MFMLTSRITEVLGLGFRVDGFVPAVTGALVMSIVSLLLNYFVAANWEGMTANDHSLALGGVT